MVNISRFLRPVESSVDFQKAYSRPQVAAERLGEFAADRHRFLDKSVLLTGERATLLTDNGRACFLDSIRLLTRMCFNVSVSIPAGCTPLREAAASLSSHIAFGKELALVENISDIRRFDAILSVGFRVHPELPWTTINSNGWVARVSSGGEKLPADCGLSNPVGALAAAALGVGEVFKRLIRLKGERGDLLNGFSYSVRRHRQEETDWGPPLPAQLVADFLIVGAGAIGNGLAHLIRQLPFHSRIDLVDGQTYGVENLGTCILIGSEELTRPKANVLADYLRTNTTVAQGFHGPFEKYVDQTKNIPEIVINGLDNIDVRHEVQRSLWPSIVIDGAIGDFTCQVSRHPWPDDIACLMCLFRKPAGRDAVDTQAGATGLSRSRLMQVDDKITEADVGAVAPEKQSFLRGRVGQPLCSVVQQAIAQKISEEQQTEGFEPSVPFVACFSACMVVAELVGHICGWHSVLAPRFQFDFLMGPARGQELPQQRRGDCICARQKNIEKIRRERADIGAIRSG
jgi:molybdopterin/thiamine biosynthesis adenylyltransferase